MGNKGKLEFNSYGQRKREAGRYREEDRVRVWREASEWKKRNKKL